MNHILRMSAKLSNISSCFRTKPNIPNPFILSSVAFNTSRNQPTLGHSHLRTAFECIDNVADAETLFHHMLQMDPTPSFCDFNMLLQIIVKMEHYTYVILMFKKLTLLGRELNEYTMNTVINCYGHIQEVESSFAVIASFMKRGYAPDIVTFNCLIKGYFLKGHIDEAVGLFKKLIKWKLFEVDRITLLTVLDGLSKSGNIVDAVQLLIITERNKWKLDVMGYTAVIDGLCKARKLEDGMQLLFRMVDRDVVPNVVTYNCLIYGLCINGKVDFGFNVFRDLGSKGINPDVITYNVTIQGLCRTGLFRDAEALVDEMEGVGCLPNDITYRVIIQGCLHHHDNLDSIKLINKIIGREFQLDAPSFFLLLRRLPELRQMKNVYDDQIINQLIQKLIIGSVMHQMRDPDDEFICSSLGGKLSYTDGPEGYEAQS